MTDLPMEDMDRTQQEREADTDELLDLPEPEAERDDEDALPE